MPAPWLSPDDLPPILPHDPAHGSLVHAVLILAVALAAVLAAVTGIVLVLARAVLAAVRRARSDAR